MSGPPRAVVLGTRGSELALAQTAIVCEALRRIQPDLELRVERITTTGDLRADVPISALGRGAFVTEIETALRERRIDVAVHSAKDLPSVLAEDLAIAAFLPRGDSRDVLVSPSATLDALPAGARVGTSSPRRVCLLRAMRPDLRTAEMRGNVDTRLRKLDAGEVEAVVLAAAGLDRLRRAARIREWFDPEVMVPCVGQGALALEVRRGDEATLALLSVLDHEPTRLAVQAERAFLAEMGAGCRAAVGAHATVRSHELRLTALIGEPGGRLVRGTRSGPAGDFQEIGAELARELLLAGGAGFLATGPSALRGRRIAVTRPREQADALNALLVARGAEPVPCPTIAIQPVTDTSALDAALRLVHEAQWLVFTSMNAVTATSERLTALRISPPEGLRVAAVGRATAALARKHLGRVDFVPSRATAELLGRELPVRAGDVVLFPRANLASDALAATLRARGAVVRDVVAYHTVPGPKATSLVKLVRDRAVDAVIFTSPSSVKFAEGIGAAMSGAGAPPAVSMGPSTTRAIEEAGFSAEEPPTQAVGALVETLERLFSVREAVST